MKRIFNFKKLLVSFLAGLVLLLSLPLPALAQTSQPWYNQGFPQWSAKVFDTSNPNEIFGERYTYAQVNWIINSLIAVVIGSNITNCIQVGAGDLSKLGDCASKLAPPDLTKTKSPSSSGFLPTIPSVAAGGSITGLAYLTGGLLSFRPASGVQYIKTTAERLHVVPQAYAQTGAGFNTLSPVQSLWQVVRDISYALMVFVIIVMAFMIMFRTKISPQVVITIQSALPKIAVALILITFSYAIAGLLVDFMYVVIGAFAAMINIAGTTGATAISSAGVADLFNQLNSINGLVSVSVGIIIVAILFAGVGAIVGAAAIPASFVLPVLGTGATLGASVVLIVFAVFLLFILFRLFWLMVRTAAVTVLLIIVGPIIILTETLGGGRGFWGWIRNLLANLAVYPTVSIMIFLSHYFFWGWAMGGLSDFGRSLLGLNTYSINALNTGGSGSVVNLPGMPIGTGVLGLVLSFVILFLIPRAAHVIEATIQGKPVDIGGAVGQGAGPLLAPAKLGVAAGVGYAGERVISGLPGGPSGRGQQSAQNILQNILKRIS